jgi:hypothetical protein
MLGPKTDPASQNTVIGVEKLADISCYQMLSADKSKKIIKWSWSLLKKLAHIMCVIKGLSC